jgi:hypothetical protein
MQRNSYPESRDKNEPKKTCESVKNWWRKEKKPDEREDHWEMRKDVHLSHLDWPLKLTENLPQFFINASLRLKF